jgi:hypothetical protein
VDQTLGAAIISTQSWDPEGIIAPAAIAARSGVMAGNSEVGETSQRAPPAVSGRSISPWLICDIWLPVNRL